MFPRILILSAALMASTGVFFPFVVSQARAGIPGGYSAVNVADQEVERMARFAIQEKNARFAKVLRAEMQVVAGRNYRLLLDVHMNNEIREAQVVVFSGLDGRLELTSWSWTGMARPEFSPIPVNNKAQLVVTNRHVVSVDRFWLKQGQEVFYGTIRPGETVVQDTFAGDEWIFRDATTHAVVHQFRSTGGRATLVLEHSTTQAQLVVDNHSNKVVTMNWLTMGREVSYGTIQPGQTKQQGTFAGHEWIFRDAATNAILLRVTSQGGRAQVVLE